MIDVRNRIDVVVADLSIKPLAKRFVVEMIEHFPLGGPLSVPLIVDYGIDSEDHYLALQEVIKAQYRKILDAGDLNEDKYDQVLRKITIQFDKAYGNGKKLNALVKKYAPAYADTVSFNTSWDELRGKTERSFMEKRKTYS